MADPSFTMEYRCGRDNSFESTTTRIECDFGAVYAITLTELRPPQDS
jgi:hypothetical protein